MAIKIELGKAYRIVLVQPWDQTYKLVMKTRLKYQDSIDLIEFNLKSELFDKFKYGLKTFTDFVHDQELFVGLPINSLDPIEVEDKIQKSVAISPKMIDYNQSDEYILAEDNVLTIQNIRHFHEIPAEKNKFSTQIRNDIKEAILGISKYKSYDIAISNKSEEVYIERRKYDQFEEKKKKQIEADDERAKQIQLESDIYLNQLRTREASIEKRENEYVQKFEDLNAEIKRVQAEFNDVKTKKNEYTNSLAGLKSAYDELWRTVDGNLNLTKTNNRVFDSSNRNWNDFLRAVTSNS